MNLIGTLPETNSLHAPENWLGHERKRSDSNHPFQVFHVSFRECSSMFFQNNCWGCTHDWCWRGWCNWKLSNVSSAHQVQAEPSVRDVIQENMHPQRSFFTYLGLKTQCLFSFHDNLVNNVADFKPYFYTKNESPPERPLYIFSRQFALTSSAVRTAFTSCGGGRSKPISVVWPAW